jgi:hypothetical protein
MNEESIERLVTEMTRIAPRIKTELVKDGIRVNRTIIRFEGNSVCYGKTRIKYKNVYNLLKNLENDGIIDLSKGDLYYLSRK